jgi:hypothetical protein
MYLDCENAIPDENFFEILRGHGTAGIEKKHI